MGRLGMMPETGESSAVELRPSGTTPACPHRDTPVLLVARHLARPGARRTTTACRLCRADTALGLLYRMPRRTHRTVLPVPDTGAAVPDR